MSTQVAERTGAGEETGTARLELERCQRELQESHRRLGELEQAEALLAGENRLLELVAKGEPLPSILEGICRLVEEVFGGSLCSILLLDPNGRQLWHAAAPSLPASYTGAFDGKTIGAQTGPCGRAAFFGAPVIVCDIAADPLGDDYRAFALAHGLHACWSTPILSHDGKTLGTFAVLSREPRSPTPQHQTIIAQITHLAAVAIERKRAEDALRRSEAYLAEAERLNHTGSWAYDVIRRVPTYWSAERCRISGLDPAQGHPSVESERAAHPPEDWSRLMETVDRAIREKSDFQTESRLVFPNGSIKHLRMVGHPVLNAAGDVVELVGSTTDVTEAKQAGVLLAGEKRLLEMVARGDSLSGVLTELCRLFEELCSGSFSSILLLDRNANRLRHGAAPSLPEDYIKAIEGGVPGPSAGWYGTAACRGKAVIVPDIAADPLWADYREVALAHGLRACWSAPIRSSDDTILGTFAIYYREPCSPAPEQQAIIDRLTHVASIVLERKLAEDTVRRGEAYLAEAQRLSRTGSFGWMVSSGELIWSNETFCILGYDRSVKPALGLVFRRVHPEDLGLVRQTIRRATREKAGFDFEHRLLMPEGEVKHLRVVAHPARAESGGVEFVGAVMDITEKKKTEDALRSAKARFKGILEIAEDAIISVDSGQRIVLFNQGAETVFGYAQAEIIGKPLSLLLPRRFAQAHRGHIQAFSESPEVSRSMGQRREVFGRRKDGSEFPAEASISKLDLGGELVFTVILRDITERKRAAELLRASETFARGQAEALVQALDALARESSPDRIVEHVLRTMTRQLDAHSSSVWLRDETTGLMTFEFALEDDKFKAKSVGPAIAMCPSLPADPPWPWPEVCRTIKPSVLDEIRERPDVPWCAHLLAQGVASVFDRAHADGRRGGGRHRNTFTQERVFRPEELELAQALTNQAMLAMQLTRLSAQSRRSAVMAERNRMARDIHDTLAQGFTGIIVQLEAAEDAKSRGMSAAADEHLGRAGILARESLNEARRSVRALRPQVLEELDLCRALDRLIREMAAGTTLKTEFSVRGGGLHRSRPIGRKTSCALDRKS